MAKLIAKLGIKREPGFLYFLRGAEVWKTPMKRAGGTSDSGKAERVLKAEFEREEGYLYFLDSNGDISRAKRAGVKKQRAAASTPQKNKPSPENRQESTNSMQNSEPPSTTNAQAVTSLARRAERNAIVDCYQLIEPLGKGYTASVWRASVVGTVPGVDLPLGSEVAIKLYHRLMESSTDTVRVQREFQVATSIDHPNLVKVYDLVLSPSRPLHNFLVMELVRGRTLKSVIPSHGMDVKRIVPIAQQIFSALSALHVQDALHRDVKAANIMLTLDGNQEIAKLCDLGIVSVIGDPSLTGTSVFMGSKHSAPFEQMVGEELDPRTDVYAAGSVMYHCYSGRPMYFRAGPEGAIVREMLRRPEQLTPRTTDLFDLEFVKIVNQCISVEPANRPATATAVVEMLAALPGIIA